MYALSIFLVMLSGYIQAQCASCDYQQEIAADTVYYIYSPGYPNYYYAGTRCRWIAECPTGYNCKLNCDIELPQTPSCSGDRLVISRIGDPMLISGETYCGAGNFTAVSTGQTISVGLFAARNSTGGRFRCKSSTQFQSTTPTTE